MLQVGAAGGALSPWSLVPVLVWLGAAQGAVNTPLVNLTLGLVRTIRPAWPPAWCRRCNRWARRWAWRPRACCSAARWRPSAGAAAGDRYAQAFASALQFNVAAIALSALLLWRLGRRG